MGCVRWIHRRCGINLNGIVPAFGDLDRFPFWAGFAIIFGLGWISILLATLLTRPESMTVLRKFYRDVRPMGLWGPVEAELSMVERESIRKYARRDLTACGWGVIFYFAHGASPFCAAGRPFLAGNPCRDSYCSDRRGVHTPVDAVNRPAVRKQLTNSGGN